jgi:GT2 family glycosyltransferase/SAM-dependent methyltransferase/tetratricopeptide (TPR) repeat protein
MSIHRIALIFDNIARPDTTGVYCLRALRELVQIEHFLPGDIERVPRSGFDLYLNIDDGLRYRLPEDLRPAAWWAIDTHIDPAWAEEKGRDFDWLFAAQRDGAERLTRSGLPASWLPLACDPVLHKPHAVEKCRDICFIGNVSHAVRRDFLALIGRHFPNSFFGQRYFDEFARTYSQSKIGFNRSVENDINMRVFETLACGPLLVTNDLRDNGQEELFQADRHLVTYQASEELIDKLHFYLRHSEARQSIARAGHAEVVGRHTYRHRMQTLLEAIERGTSAVSRPLSVPSRQPSIVAADGAVPIPDKSEIRDPKSQIRKGLDQIDFVVKTFLRPQALLRLLQSILEFYPGAHVTIADDGNLRESAGGDSRACCDLIDRTHRFTLHTLAYAAGVTAGRNLLVDKTSRPFLLLLDDDFCFTAQTKIERLVERLQSDPQLGVVAGTCVDVVGDERRPRNSGGTLEIHGDTLIIDTAGWRDREAELRDYVPQFALIRREVFNDVRWEGDIGGEHYDFCLQLQSSRWKVAQDLAVQIDHRHFTPALPGYAECRFDCAAAQQWLLHKWNLTRIVQDGTTIVESEGVEKATGSPKAEVENPSSEIRNPTRPLPSKDFSYFEHARPDVAALVPQTARRILDIGCGAGRLGALLKERQHAEVVGIELQLHAAALARAHLDEVLLRSVEDPGLDFPPGRFDCVICADILEHLREPGDLLAKIRNWLTPDGCLVASLPNVRHHSVVSSLLGGNWTYESAGLLDSDHVRFFTRREMEKLLYRQRFEIEQLHAKPGPGYEEWAQSGRPDIVQVGSLNISGLTFEDAEEFFTYQYLLVARPASPAPSQEHSLSKLARDYPWPAAKPNAPIPTDKLGWFKESPRELIRQEVNSETRLVVELGAWLGLSTRFIADLAPQARVVTIDHWQGSREHAEDPACAAMIPTLFHTFVDMNWEYRDRILPLRMMTAEGLHTIADYGLHPDVIFIDADHAYQSVSADLRLARQLFPQARIIGDDYDYPDVRRAVDEFAVSKGLQVEPVGTGWRAWRLVVAPRPDADDQGQGNSCERQSDTEEGRGNESTQGGTIPHSELHPGLTSIVIVTCNQLAYTQECVDSIRRRTDEPYELIFVDNGSTDGTVEYLRNVAGRLRVPCAARGACDPQYCTVIENAVNRGFPAGANQGLATARGEYLLLLNNDTVVTTGWLRRMLDVMQADGHVGLVGPCSNNVSGAQMIPVTYGDMACLDGFAWEWGKRHHGIVEATDRLIGFCLLVRRALLDQIGLLDERFGIGCFEDDDLCLRALRAGWQAVIARAAFVHHYGNRTFRGNGVDLADVLNVNREKFLRKWEETISVERPEPTEEPNNSDRCEVQDPKSKISPNGVPASTDLCASPSSILDPPSSKPAIPRFTLECAPTGGLLLKPVPIKLSLCMIVRDNERTIDPCLESIRPWVDEIVVVDTGSTDCTPEVCKSYGARLFEFPWCDDFSAARNESLKHARGEWLFWMDSDDTIPAECGRKLRALADGPHPDKIAGYIMQVHCPAPGDDGHVDVTVVDHLKLIRNRPDLRFSGRIHEQLLPAIRNAGGDVAWTDIYVVHSGSEHSPEAFQRKLERDLRILHQELREQPDHPFVLFNLGMTCADAANHISHSELRTPHSAPMENVDWLCAAIDFLQRCLAVSNREESHLRKAYALLASSLAQADRHDDAWERCRQGLGLYPDDKELLFRCAMLHHHFGRLNEAAYFYLRVLNDPEERHFTSIDRGLAGYKALHNLAIVYGDMARPDQAEEQWRAIIARIPGYRPAWRGLADVLLKQGQLGEAATALRRLVECDPRDAAACHDLATACCQLNRFDEAVAWYRKSLELRPGAPVTQRQLEFAISRLQRRKEAPLPTTAS